MRRGARESHATEPERAEGCDTSATSGAKARSREPSRMRPRRPASERRLSKTKTSSTPGRRRATASPRGEATRATSHDGQRAFSARTAGPRNTVSPRKAGWTRRKRTGRSGKRSGLLDEHHRDAVPDLVDEPAARAVDLVAILVELEVPLAPRAGEDLLQLGRERHRHLRGPHTPGRRGAATTRSGPGDGRSGRRQPPHALEEGLHRAPTGLLGVERLH